MPPLPRISSPTDPTYTPQFVTQTDTQPPWNDCLWASAAMFIDKLSEGRVQPGRRLLRLASGDMVGGSTFGDLRRSLAYLYGMQFKWSPYGGEALTWGQLLDRLARGSGAIIAGTYGNLGFPYTRWSLRYAANPNAAGHAVYVDRYDPQRGQIWLMDPLGRGGYAGEWVPIERVWSFIWKRNQFVYAAVTPPVVRTLAPVVVDELSPSIHGYQLNALELPPGPYRAGDDIELRLPFVDQLPWELPALRIEWQWQLLSAQPGSADPFLGEETVGDPQADPDEATDPDEPAEGDAPSTASGGAPNQAADDGHALPLEAAMLLRALGEHEQEIEGLLNPSTEPAAPNQEEPLETAPVMPSGSGQLVGAGDGLTATIALPGQPGVWELVMLLTDQQGQALPAPWQQPALRFDVWGERGAIVRPLALGNAATPIALHAEAASDELGEERSAARATPALWAGEQVPIEISVSNTGQQPWQMLTWAPEHAAPGDEIVLTELTLSWVNADGVATSSQAVTLVVAPDEQITVKLALVAPSRPGDYALRFDVVADGVSYAAEGVAMPTLQITVHGPLELPANGPI